MEVLLKGGLRAGDAHGIVHVVAALLLIGRPGILGDGAGVAQQVGGVLGLILAHRGGLDLHPPEVQLLHPGDEVHIHILGKVVGGPVRDPAAVVELIQHPGHRPGVPRVHIPQVQGGHGLSRRPGRLLIHRPLALDVQIPAHLAQQLLGGGQAVGLGLFPGLLLLPEAHQGQQAVPQAGLLLLGGVLLRDLPLRQLLRVLDPPHVDRQTAQTGHLILRLPRFIGGGGVKGVLLRIGEGRRGGDGQGVRPGHPLLPGHLDQGEQIGAALLRLSHPAHVQGHLIGDLIGDQHLSVPVQDQPPAGGDVLDLGHPGHRLGGVLRPVGVLDAVQVGAQKGEQQGQHQHHAPDPTVKLLGIQGSHHLLSRGSPPASGQLGAAHPPVDPAEDPIDHGGPAQGEDHLRHSDLEQHV